MPAKVRALLHDLDEAARLRERRNLADYQKKQQDALRRCRLHFRAGRKPKPAG